MVGRESGDPGKLTSNPGSESAPAVSPAGNRLAFLQTRARGEETDLRVVDLANDGTFRGIPRNLTDDWDRRPGAPTWAAHGEAVRFLAGVGGDRHLFEVTLTGDLIRQLTSGDRQVSSVSTSDDGLIMAYTVTDAVSPAEVYVNRGDGTKRVLVVDLVVRSLLDDIADALTTKTVRHARDNRKEQPHMPFCRHRMEHPIHDLADVQQQSEQAFTRVHAARSEEPEERQTQESTPQQSCRDAGLRHNLQRHIVHYYAHGGPFNPGTPPSHAKQELARACGDPVDCRVDQVQARVIPQECRCRHNTNAESRLGVIRREKRQGTSGHGDAHENPSPIGEGRESRCANHSHDHEYPRPRRPQDRHREYRREPHRQKAQAPPSSRCQQRG